MRISRHLGIRGAAVAAVLALGAIAGPGGALAADKFTSKTAAFEQGFSAYRAGYYEIAVPALEFAASKGFFWAQYFLARIYADPSSAHTNHGKAYDLYYRIVYQNADMDTFDKRAGHFAKAMAALADYVMKGNKSFNLRPDPVQAARLLRSAAYNYKNIDAQFELAKLYFSGQGVRKDPGLGKDQLSRLHQKGHAGASAWLAEIYWDGKFKIPQDKEFALALAKFAAANAREHNRFWIEKTYHDIYCDTTKGTRKGADKVVAGWNQNYRRRARNRRAQLGFVSTSLERTCSNGDLVPVVNGPGADLGRPPAPVLAKRPRPRGSLKAGSGR